MAVQSKQVEVNGTKVYLTPTGVRLGSSKAKVVSPRDAFQGKGAMRRLRKTHYRLGRTDLVRRSLS
jgi:hypothetical protein